MYNLNNAPQALLDKYYEINKTTGLPQVAIEEIILCLQKHKNENIKYIEERFETRLKNGELLPQVHIMILSTSQVPVAVLNRDPIYCSSISQIHAENNDTTQKYLRKIESGEGLDPL